MAKLKTRARIFVLVILAALPALLLTVYSAIERRASTENQARAELGRLVKLAAMQQWQVVEGARQMMVASSQILFTLLGDRKRCTEYFASLLAQNREAYHSMGLFTPDGQLFCNAASWRDKVYSGDRLYFRLARKTGRFAVGEYQVGRVTGKAGINFGFPLIDADDKVYAVACAGLDLENLGRMAEATPLPPEGILSVVDVKGTILARKPAMPERVGERLWNPQVIEAVLAGREGALEQRERKLQEQAISDPLTGLYNRRYLSEFLPRELVRSRRNATPVAVMLIDLDHFKRVNDSFGHEAGDIVLKAIAALLKGKVRGSDMACRYGGEEFALILPETNLDTALRRAEVIRLAIARLDLSHAGTSLGKITTSLGIALFPDHGEDSDALLRVADVALYGAKGAGRDRIVVGSVKKR